MPKMAFYFMLREKLNGFRRTRSIEAVSKFNIYRVSHTKVCGTHAFLGF